MNYDRVNELTRALEDEDWDVRLETTEALGEIGDSRAVEPLIKAIGDEDWNIQQCAIKALGKIGTN